MNPKHIILAKKLLALATQGIDGEKLNAQEKLEEHLKRHGLKIEDIEDEKPKPREFDMRPEQLTFFKQVASSVIGAGFTIYKHPTNPNKVYLNVTTAEHAEIAIKFKFYYDDYMKHVHRYLAEYKKRIKLFYRAYVEKNELFIKGTIHHTKQMTEQEEHEWTLMQRMAGNIQKTTVIVPTDGGNKQSDEPLKRLE